MPDKPPPEGTRIMPEMPAHARTADDRRAMAPKFLKQAHQPGQPPASTAGGKGPENPDAAPSTEPQPRAAGGVVFASPRNRMLTYTLIAAAIGIAAAWFLAAFCPHFLLYGTRPEKADAIVLLLGTADPARRKQVDALAAAGLARYVIEPWTGTVHPIGAADQAVEAAEAARIARGIKTDAHRAWVERTHVEMLQTRALMDRMDLSSAIVVSSPYHMRRIKIIADHNLHPTRYKLTYVPTAYEPVHVPWFLVWDDVKWVFSEWGKIVWYFLYSPFV